MMKARVHTPQTVEELRAEIEARRPYAIAVKEAFLRNDIADCEAAQKAMRDFCRDQDGRRA